MSKQLENLMKLTELTSEYLKNAQEILQTAPQNVIETLLPAFRVLKYYNANLMLSLGKKEFEEKELPENVFPISSGKKDFVKNSNGKRVLELD